MLVGDYGGEGLFGEELVEHRAGGGGVLGSGGFIFIDMREVVEH